MLHTVCNTTVTVVQVWYGLCCCHSYVYTTHARVGHQQSAGGPACWVL